MAAGEIDVFGKLVARTVAGKIADAKQIDGLEEMIASAIQPASDKEIFSVLTYDSTEPESPVEGDYYINSESNKLYSYTSGAWVEETPDTEVLYVAADTSHIYVWNGAEFVDSTGQEVDGLIVVTNLTTDLAGYTDVGLYNVYNSASLTYYSLIVGVESHRTGRLISSYNTQVLYNKDGWQIRTKSATMSLWGAWEEHKYEVHVIEVANTVASQELAPNTLYKFASRTSALTLTLGTPVSDIANEYHLFLVVGSTAPTITWPTGISWNGGSAPTIAADKTYEVSILNNIAAFMEI